MEIWKDINGYEGLYQISDTGKVKSCAKEWSTYRGNKKSKPESFLKPFYSRKYHIVELSKNGSKKIWYIHRLVAIHFIPNHNNFPEVNHEDGNTLNNHADNLKWCDKEYNMRHAVENGLIKGHKGESNASSKLTENDVRRIRALRLDGMSYSTIAKIYNVDFTNIACIVKRKTWKHIA